MKAAFTGAAPITPTELRLLTRWSKAPHTLFAFNDPQPLRFKQPILDCCEQREINAQKRFALVRFVFHHMAMLAKPYWQWDAGEWIALIEERVPPHRQSLFWPQVVVLAFDLGGLNLVTAIMPRRYKTTELAAMLWGAEVVETSISLIRDCLVSIGYRVEKSKPAGRILGQTLVATMLALDEPDVRRWDETAHHALIGDKNPVISVSLGGKRRDYALSAALALHRLRIFSIDPQVHSHGGSFAKAPPTGYTAEWAQWTDRYAHHSVAAKATTRQMRYFLHFVGRWALRYHPDAARSPADWDVDMAADFAGFLANGKVGDLQPNVAAKSRQYFGNPLTANTKASRISMIRVLFDTLIESGLIRRRVRHARCVPASTRDCTGSGAQAARFRRRCVGHIVVGWA